jgi:tetratricopeptide (TPR) repeat protein
LEDVPPAWRDDELERIGKIWTTLGDYDAALKVFERARTAWSGQASLRSLEQLVNVKAKYACQLLAADPDDAKATDLLEEAATSIGGLLRVSATPERLSILGSLERRRAQFPALGPVREALEKSLAAYRQAEDLHVDGAGDVPGAGVDHYSGLNSVVVSWLLSFHGAPGPDVEEAVATIARCADAVVARPCPDFWCRVTPADCALTRALVEGRLTDPRVRDGVAYEYEAVFAARSTRRERLTVVEHLEVLERCLPADGSDDRVAETRRALLDLRERLNARV